MQFSPEQIHESCKGCARINEENQTCKVFEKPRFKWEPRPGVLLAPGQVLYCSMATHFEMMSEEMKQKINPLKASKRSMGGGGKNKKKKK